MGSQYITRHNTSLLFLYFIILKKTNALFALTMNINNKNICAPSNETNIGAHVALQYSHQELVRALSPHHRDDIGQICAELAMPCSSDSTSRLSKHGRIQNMRDRTVLVRNHGQKSKIAGIWHTGPTLLRVPVERLRVQTVRDVVDCADNNQSGRRYSTAIVVRLVCVPVDVIGKLFNSFSQMGEEHGLGKYIPGTMQ